jgi:hypothetical protein
MKHTAPLHLTTADKLARLRQRIALRIGKAVTQSASEVSSGLKEASAALAPQPPQAIESQQ